MISGKIKKLDGGGENWMVTFSDLMTLLFCFFVLLTILSIQPKDCKELINYMEENSNYYKDFEVRSNKQECIISLPADFLFVSGSAKIQKKNIKRLDPLFDAIKGFREYEKDLIIVDGHTDNVRIRTKKYRNNWELSADRATNLATYLIFDKNYDRERVSVRAFGESRPRISYFDKMGRNLNGNSLQKVRKTNRRVELVLAEKPKDYDLINLLFDGK